MLSFLCKNFSGCGGCTWQTEMADDGSTLNTLGSVMESEHLSLARSLEMLALCRELGCPLTLSAMVSAAGLPHTNYPFQYMQWLVARGCPVGTVVCATAASGAPHELARLHMDKEWGWPKSLLDELTGSQHPGGLIKWPLAKLQWLRTRGVPWSSGTVSAAAKYGNMDLLRWALGGGCKLDGNAMAMAASRGRVEVMRWLSMQGCEPTPHCVVQAAANGQQLAFLLLVDEMGMYFDPATQQRAKAALVGSMRGAEETQDDALYRRTKALEAIGTERGLWETRSCA